MRLFLSALTLGLTLGTLAVAPAQAQEPTPARRPAVMHYPTLEKMLRRFSREAGTVQRAQGSKVYAAR
jgi:hypothetical protein